MPVGLDKGKAWVSAYTWTLHVPAGRGSLQAVAQLFLLVTRGAKHTAGCSIAELSREALLQTNAS
jgi:hypothetical protein